MQSPDLYFVRLDLAEVRRLARIGPDPARPPADGSRRGGDADDPFEWLTARGFLLAGGGGSVGWYVGPDALSLLPPIAIRYCRPADVQDSVAQEPQGG